MFKQQSNGTKSFFARGVIVLVAVTVAVGMATAKPAAAQTACNWTPLNAGASVTGCDGRSGSIQITSSPAPTSQNALIAFQDGSNKQTFGYLRWDAATWKMHIGYGVNGTYNESPGLSMTSGSGVYSFNFGTGWLGFSDGQSVSTAPKVTAATSYVEVFPASTVQSYNSVYDLSYSATRPAPATTTTTSAPATTTTTTEAPTTTTAPAGSSTTNPLPSVTDPDYIELIGSPRSAIEQITDDLNVYASMLLSALIAICLFAVGLRVLPRILRLIHKQL